LKREARNGEAHQPALAVDDPRSWDRVIEAIDPAAMLVAIYARIGPALRAQLTAEDVWQEALLVAWRKRDGLEWRGLPSFRRWLLEVAEGCIWDARDRALALKRGGGALQVGTTNRDGAASLPVFESATPSRVAQLHEQSQLMLQALAALPDDVREIVRLRIFEECTSEEIARRLALGVSAVKHRFRRGVADYQRQLHTLLSTIGARRPRP
jgi:RNA polymerase sigma-70 factor (ECF subfamily)